MNNLVFNTTATQLKTSVYGETTTPGVFHALQIDNNDNLLVYIQNTSIEVTGSVTIANTSLTVAGTVTIGNTSLTVAGTVTVGNTSLTVAGTVTIGNTTLTVYTDGTRFDAITLSATAVTTDTVLLADTDLSEYKNAAFMLYNDSTQATVTLQLEVSPTDSATDYIVDTVLGTVTLAASGNLYVPVQVIGKNVQLIATSSTTSSDVHGYFVGQV